MTSILSSLAILKVEWDAGRDYIDSFLPFVLETLRSTQQPQVSLPEVQEMISREFEFHIPQGALKTILQRATSRGYVQRKEGVYHKIQSALEGGSIAGLRADCIREQDALASRLAEFALQEHRVEWSTEVAETALLTFIRKQSLPILTAAVEGAPIRMPDQDDNTADFIVGGFITRIERMDPESFGFLEATVKGSMLSDVLYFPELGQATRRFADADIYLDTPVILRTLGLTISGEQAAFREMVDLLYELNASIRCFEHTLREVKGVLHAASIALSNPKMLRTSFGDATEYFVKTGSTPSDVELMIARLENRLANHHIRIEANPEYAASTTIEEKKLAELLMDQVGYAREDTMEHDLRAVASVFALRNGKLPQSIEDCDAIFVTNNTKLVKSCLNFFKSEYGEQASMVPICVPHHTISTLAWLKKPLRAPDLPDKMVIANSYAALNPPDKLWRMYLVEIGKLEQQGDIGEEDYSLLRFSSEARSLLMDRTLGDHTAFAEGTVPEILERAKENIREGAEQKYQWEKRERLATERHSLAYRENVEQRIRAIAVWTSKLSLWVLYVVGAIILVGGTIFTFPGRSAIKPLLLSNVLFVLFLLMTGVSILNAVFGTSLVTIARTIEMSILRSVEGFLIKYLTGTPREGDRLDQAP